MLQNFQKHLHANIFFWIYRIINTINFKIKKLLTKTLFSADVLVILKITDATKQLIDRQHKNWKH